MTALSTHEFIECVASLDEPNLVSQALFAQGQEMGFSGLAMAWRQPRGSRENTHFELVSLPNEYFRRYSQNRYDEHSAVVSHMNSTVHPFRWQELSVDPIETPLAHRILQEAVEFGLRFGWTIPVHATGRVTGFITGFSEDARDTPSQLDRFHLMALCAHSRVGDLRGNVHIRSAQLTDLEREIISWLATGQTVADVAVVLGISERIVGLQVAQVGAKLNTATLAHTVVEAARQKLIDP